MGRNRGVSIGFAMSALGQKQTSAHVQTMSALPRKRTWVSAVAMSGKGQKRAFAACASSNQIRGIDGSARRAAKSRLSQILEVVVYSASDNAAPKGSFLCKGDGEKWNPTHDRR